MLKYKSHQNNSLLGHKMFTVALPLNARNPKINMNPPMKVSGIECPGIVWAHPSSENLPFLGPINMQPTKATVPPNR